MLTFLLAYPFHVYTHNFWARYNLEIFVNSRLKNERAFRILLLSPWLFVRIEEDPPTFTYYTLLVTMWEENLNPPLSPLLYQSRLYLIWRVTHSSLPGAKVAISIPSISSRKLNPAIVTLQQEKLGCEVGLGWQTRGEKWEMMVQGWPKN